MPIDFAPPGLPAWAALLLVAVSVATSAVSGAFGIGGGVTLLAVMASFMPVPVLIPVHGLVQLGSNAGRAALLLRHAAFGRLAPFLAGALVGVAAGSALVTELPEDWLRLAIGVFVLWAAFGRLPALGSGSRAALGAGGFASTMLTMFVGATGPFVMALLRRTALERRALVATAALAMTFQHGLKLVAFAAIGFAFGPWLPFVAAMVAAGFVGTYLGTRLLKALPEAAFRRGLSLILAVVAAQLIVRAVWSILA